MSDNTLVFVAVIAFMAIFVIALGVVIVVLIVQCIKDRGKKKTNQKVITVRQKSIHTSVFCVVKWLFEKGVAKYKRNAYSKEYALEMQKATFENSIEVYLP